MKHIINLDGKSDHKTEHIGGKGQNLNLLNKKGYTTPRTAVLPSTVFTDFVLGTLEVVDITFDTILDESKRLQDKIHQIKLQEEIIEDIENLIEYSKNAKFAIRSSAPMEDGEKNSFAGQFDSVLNVESNIEDIQKAIKTVWSSLYSIRALSYCIANDIDIKSLKMAVVMQEMIEMPDTAGTLFTYDIKQNSKETLCIQAVNGLGDKVVDGSGDVTTYTIRKSQIESDLQMLEETLIEKHLLKELSEGSLSIEKSFETYQDIEWVISNGKIYYLQTRPITTI